VPSYPENEPASGGLGEHWDPDLGGSAALGLAGLAAQPAGATVVGLTESARPIEIARPINRSMTGATLPSRRGHLSFSTLPRNTRVDYRANTDDERDRQSVLVQREPSVVMGAVSPWNGDPS
jgi:transposase InsO family protein